MESQQINNLTDTIADLNMKISELANKLNEREKNLALARSQYERERIQHEYLQTMYDELLDKAVKR